MKRAPVLVVGLITFCNILRAAPAPPLEDLLLRAETVMLVQISAVTDHSVTVRPTELLRGATAGPEITLDFDSEGPDLTSRAIGSQLLLLSQGDAHYGPPRRVVGRPMDGQHVWCGWTALLIVTIGEQTYAEPIFSFADGAPSSDIQNPKGPKLSLSRIRQLVQRFPYNPHINDKT